MAEICSGNIVAIVQARMASSRLPGKVLKEISGKPMLEYLLERLGRAKTIDQIVVATSDTEADLPVVEYCRARGTECFTGSENNVLERFYQAATHFDARVVVRICGDSPLIDPDMTDELVHEFLQDNGKLDYLTNTLHQTCPLGTNTEVFSYEALKRAHAGADTAYQKEHVTPFFYQHPDDFRIREKHYRPDTSAYRLTVDTPDDFRLVETVISNLEPLDPEMPLNRILAFLDNNPELQKINKHVRQNRIHYSNE
jgi:spore coat polysaccharide biosynthesis protein SpsF